MLPDDPRHGTSAGYLAETKAGVDHCQPCRDARARYQRYREYDMLLGRPRTVPSIGARRRVRALQRMGWSLSMIAKDAGWNTAEALQYVMKSQSINRRSWTRIAECYDRLAMKTPPYNSASVRARKRAERLGYPPPLAWDSIDDPNERPSHDLKTPSDPVSLQSRLDMAVVWRLVDEGVRVRQLSGAEAVEVCRILTARGLSGQQIEQRYGLKPDRYKESAA